MKTIIFLTNDLDHTSTTLKLVSQSFVVTFVPESVFPEMHFDYNQIGAIVIFSERLTENALKKIDVFLISRSSIPIVFVSPFIDHSFITATRNRTSLNKIEVLSDISELPDFLKLKVNNHCCKARNIWAVLKDYFWGLNPKPEPRLITENNFMFLPSAISKSENIEEVIKLDDVISVQYLGDFSIQFNGKTFVPKNNAVLLGYLLFNHEKKIYREQLIEKFWPDSTYDSAKNCLNAAIFSIRKMLSEFTKSDKKLIIFENDFYAINKEHFKIHTDLDNFLEHWELARTIIRTKSLLEANEELKTVSMIYKGDFMPNLHSDWVISKRDDFAEKYFQVLNWLAECKWQMHDYQESIIINNQILNIDECVETSHRRLIQCYVELKMTERAIRQYKKCKEALAKINVEPSAEIQSLYLKIVNQTAVRG